MSNNTNVMSGLEQLSSHFGRGADAASLTKGVVVGPDDIHDVISILTDIAKVTPSYAEDLGSPVDWAE